MNMLVLPPAHLKCMMILTSSESQLPPKLLEFQKVQLSLEFGEPGPDRRDENAGPLCIRTQAPRTVSKPSTPVDAGPDRGYNRHELAANHILSASDQRSDTASVI
jgi:hypothetical protein